MPTDFCKQIYVLRHNSKFCSGHLGTVLFFAERLLVDYETVQVLWDVWLLVLDIC